MIAVSPFRSEFPHPESLLYFNHAGVGPIPRCAAQRLAELSDHMACYGAWRYAEVLAPWQEAARVNLGRLLGVAADAISLVLNTSEGVSFVALGIDWRPGDEVVTTDQEFPSNIVVWLDVAARHGVTVHRVPSLADGGVDAGALLARVGPRTRVVAVSSVQYGTGAVVDVATLGRELAKTDTLLVVDAIQGLGVLPMDLPALGVDALTADGHKWLLGPEGCGLLTLSAKGMSRIRPRVLGWHSVANAGEYDRITTELRPGGRRFEAGSPNLLGAAALAESVRLLLECGPEVVAARVRGLAGAMVRGLRERGCRIHTPLLADGAPGAGIVVFSHPQADNRSLDAALRARGIFQVRRGAGIRWSPHFYQDEGDVARALTLLDEALHGLK
ncbi:MAG: aminotransferase class V-fold PLP-dependent enzyme [Magnetococcales bacterium]|nr:aminotransferase class V-fold PLP-dependent enzyme [Magnetococcales bacterium]MBF0157742.1 aminotransferase class V-fold PLP-dependent enzyme [Magnetococcales bacterium]